MTDRRKPRPFRPPSDLRALLRRARARLGLTQAQAAEALGCHRVTLAKWETGAEAPRGLALRCLVEWARAAIEGRTT